MIKKRSKNVPSLRFPGFIEKWKTKRIGDICDCIVPGRNKPKTFNGDIPWVTVPDIENERINTSSTSLKISREQAKSIGSKVIPKGSVLMSCAGEPGLTAITDCEIIINQQLHAFLPSALINNIFLLHCIRTQKKYIDSITTKTAVPYLNKSNCNSIPITFPPLTEQKRVAVFLDAIATHLTQLRRKHELLQTYKRGVMQKIFSQQIRFKQDDGIPFSDWESSPLKAITKIYDGTHQTPQYVKQGVPFYSVEHLTANDFSETKFIAEEVFLKEKKRASLERGDILMTRIGDIGTCRLLDWDVRASFYVSLALIKNNKLTIPAFLSYSISSVYFQKELHRRTIHVAFPRKINLGEIGNCKVLVPCIEEQRKIANCLSPIDQKIEALGERISLIEKFKQGLLQKMFV